MTAFELAFYDFASCAAKRQRSELRDLTGWHECTKIDLHTGMTMDSLASYHQT
ncbi:hypothetical protein [Streptomyces sp. NRRL F-5630]|uniref:hypothetical protein n=1 Tax=Streptomyces sp. NRRL F-5630 TaxID=1463864 RepID=UPI003D725D62